jgi:hypothetical protein
MRKYMDVILAASIFAVPLPELCRYCRPFAPRYRRFFNAGIARLALNIPFNDNLQASYKHIARDRPHAIADNTRQA